MSVRLKVIQHGKGLLKLDDTFQLVWWFCWDISVSQVDSVFVVQEIPVVVKAILLHCIKYMCILVTPQQPQFFRYVHTLIGVPFVSMTLCHPCGYLQVELVSSRSKNNMVHVLFLMYLNKPVCSHSYSGVILMAMVSRLDWGRSREAAPCRR